MRAVAAAAAARRAVSSLVVVLALVAVPETARAIPAFARKYEMSCRTCHARAYPELNPLGRRFLENGYQLPAGAETRYRDRALLAPGTVDEKLGLPRVLPLALRARSAVQIPVDFAATQQNAVDFLLLEKLDLLAGGAINRDVSFLASLALRPDVTLHHGAMGLHNLFFGEGHLNFRAGQLLLFDFLHPSHRSLTRAIAVGAATPVGKNPTVLDTTHVGFEIYGRGFSRALFYELAVVQGAQGSDGIHGLDGNKDGFAQLQVSLLDAATLGALGYLGRTDLRPGGGGTATDAFYVVGGDLEAPLGPVVLFGYLLYGHHESPLGTGVPADYLGWRAEATWGITDEMVAVLRFDGIEGSSAVVQSKRILTAHFTHLPATNFKQSVEVNVDLVDPKRSVVYLLLDLAL